MVILHIPHSSKVVPHDLLSEFRLSEMELEDELICMTDSYTDELFDVNTPTVLKVVFPVSRLVVDPERFLDDDMEPMAQRGMGVIYTSTSSLQPLRKGPSKEVRDSLVSTYYTPHHNMLKNAVDRYLSESGRCLILDCHSFPSSPLPYEPDQLPNRPDICIGTDDFHTPQWLSDLALKLFVSHHLRTELNRPYSGAIVPFEYYKSNPSVWAVMLEINRSVYMNEQTGERLEEFEDFKCLLQTVLKELIATAQAN